MGGLGGYAVYPLHACAHTHRPKRMHIAQRGNRMTLPTLPNLLPQHVTSRRRIGSVVPRREAWEGWEGWEGRPLNPRIKNKCAINCTDPAGRRRTDQIALRVRSRRAPGTHVGRKKPSRVWLMQKPALHV